MLCNTTTWIFCNPVRYLMYSSAQSNATGKNISVQGKSNLHELTTGLRKYWITLV
jgi:hypothetical protein